jgi:hypothetical protein
MIWIVSPIHVKLFSSLQVQTDFVANRASYPTGIRALWLRIKRTELEDDRSLYLVLRLKKANYAFTSPHNLHGAVFV